MAVLRPQAGCQGGAARAAAAGAALLLLALLLLALKGRGAQRGAVGALAAALKPAGRPCRGRRGAAADVQQQMRGALPAGTIPMQHPSRELFEKVEANPGLPESDEAVAGEFVAAPWLLPPRTKALPYAGVHDLDELLRLRGSPQGKHPKTVTLLTFNKRFAVMTQNSIYSMVKFGGVRNYVVGCWTPEDLAACADLNLPCTDVARFLPEPMNNAPDAGTFNSHDYLVVCWLRPALLVHLLGLGYAVLSTDSDIVYFVKPVWQSYLRFIEEAGADGAFQAEVPVNGGNYVVLPTPAAIRWAQAWAALAPEMIQRVTHDQSGFRLVEEARWKLCGTVESCQGERAAIANATAAASPGGNATAAAPPALLRIYLPRYFGYWDDLCAFAAMHRLPRFDPCDWAVMYLHPICLNHDAKLAVLRYLQAWFLDDASCAPRNGTASQVAACRPLRWREPAAEARLYSCGEYGLGLTHERWRPPRRRGGGAGG